MADYLSGECEKKQEQKQEQLLSSHSAKHFRSHNMEWVQSERRVGQKKEEKKKVGGFLLLFPLLQEWKLEGSF